MVSKNFAAFFHSKMTISHLQSNQDIIVAYDVDSILTKSGITDWGLKKLKVITFGESINKMKKVGIFTHINDTTDFIIVYQNMIDTVSYFGVFRPHTGADGHIEIKKINGQYLMQKLSYGWF